MEVPNLFNVGLSSTELLGMQMMATSIASTYRILLCDTCPIQDMSVLEPQVGMVLLLFLQCSGLYLLPLYEIMLYFTFFN